jgi:hypothetical protein
MTNGVNAPNGLIPANSMGAFSDSGKTNEYPITATYGSTMFTGDLVTLGTAGTVIRATATNAALGVFQGCKYIPASNNNGTVAFPYWPGNPGVLTGTTPVAVVLDDPNAIFSVQETGSTATQAGTALTQVNVGNNANVLYTAGSTITGISAVSLDNSSVATTTTPNLKIVGLDPTIGNAQGNYANWLVQINNHIYKSGSVRP